MVSTIDEGEIALRFDAGKNAILALFPIEMKHIFRSVLHRLLLKDRVQWCTTASLCRLARWPPQMQALYQDMSGLS